jgi:hypothetical protein
MKQKHQAKQPDKVDQQSDGSFSFSIGLLFEPAARPCAQMSQMFDGCL